MDKKIAEYKLVFEYTGNNDLENFNREVNGYISEGWQPHGEHKVSVTWDKVNDTDVFTISQVMVKYHNPNP